MKLTKRPVVTGGAIATLVTFGLQKWLFTEVDGLRAIFLSVALAWGGLLALIIIWGGQPGVKQYVRQTRLPFACIGLLAAFVYALFLIPDIARLTSYEEILLSRLTWLMALVFAFASYTAKTSGRSVIAFILGTIGLLLACTNGDFSYLYDHWITPVMLMTIAFCLAFLLFYFVYSRNKRLDRPVDTTATYCVFAAIFTVFSVLVLLDTPSFKTWQIAVLAWNALFVHLLVFGWWSLRDKREAPEGTFATPLLLMITMYALLQGEYNFATVLGIVAMITSMAISDKRRSVDNDDGIVSPPSGSTKPHLKLLRK